MWFSSLLLKKTETWDCFVSSLFEPERTVNWLKVCKRVNLIPQVGFPKGYSVIITHNEYGEYGQWRHKEVHDQAKKTEAELLVPTYPEGSEIDCDSKRELIEMYDDTTKAGVKRCQSLLKNYKWRKEGFRFIR